jgi:hypothetical protein
VTFELLFAFFLHNPKWSPLPVDVVRVLYEREFRSVIQSDPKCVVYDNQLTYRLKPGGCRFANIEFDTLVSANSAGLRDNEEALEGPEIIFLGDSTTMGWGVEDEQTFAEIFERTTGMRSLNAGISSYGTPRELMLLSTLDQTNLSVVFIQYSANDVRETRRVATQGEIKALPEKDYWDFMSRYQERIGYFPGRYTLVAAYYAWRGLTDDFELLAGEDLEPLDQEIEFLVKTLATMGLPGPHVRIFLFETACNGARPGFSEGLRQALKEAKRPELTRLEVLDFTNQFTSDMCFEIDGHINQKGHAKVGELLVTALGEYESKGPDESAVSRITGRSSSTNGQSSAIK